MCQVPPNSSQSPRRRPDGTHLLMACKPASQSLPTPAHACLRLHTPAHACSSLELGTPRQNHTTPCASLRYQHAGNLEQPVAVFQRLLDVCCLTLPRIRDRSLIALALADPFHFNDHNPTAKSKRSCHRSGPPSEPCRCFAHWSHCFRAEPQATSPPLLSVQPDLVCFRVVAEHCCTCIRPPVAIRLFS